jgi:thiopurine S-methyltransferase
MKKEFWLEKWQNQQTGFHRLDTHPLLIKYIDKLELNRGDTVFVPLSGKSVDMLWLHESGYNVIAVELSELAVVQFFEENELLYAKANDGVFNVYTYKNITIYQGDFFDLTKKHLKNVKAVYDRAALIALPTGLVEKYVAHMYQITAAVVKTLLITLELQRSNGSLGPPFSISENRVATLYNGFKTVQLLQVEDIIEREQGFQKQGCQFVYERVYLLEN